MALPHSQRWITEPSISDNSSLKDGFWGFRACIAENAREVVTETLLAGDGVEEDIAFSMLSMAGSTD
jgi:hypothetical protein